jgi:hypothetical protein
MRFATEVAAWRNQGRRNQGRRNQGQAPDFGKLRDIRRGFAARLRLRLR